MARQTDKQGQQPDSAGYIPKFEWSFLSPRYWGVWFGIFVLIVLTFSPVRFRDRFLSRLGRFIGRKIKSARQRAQINLAQCFPEKSEAQRDEIIDEMFSIILPVTVLLVDLTIKKTRVKINWHGFEHITQAHNHQRNVIFMVPHAWAIDIPAILLAKKGYAMSGMFHHQSNKLVDWLWNKSRIQYGGQIHAREDGIKPFVQSIRQGNWGFYLPDEDHGIEQSVFVDFFGTYKATLPILGRLMKLCKADVIPLFPSYDLKNSELNIYLHPPMNDLADKDDDYIARRMNEEIERFVTPDLKQYAWVLRFLKTRKSDDPELYS
ncbi:lauroyl-Kdo(2)-lipid IV(A) myristoyltransferase [Utexia brackfieldae]|uniref:lauroyl-Kdo(2)-lipid IV(A) myristoyltransferase n=1 Tax=Utexia brackfieldae TaxID=3074108 RepID=UPI00370D8DD9